MSLDFGMLLDIGELADIELVPAAGAAGGCRAGATAGGQ